MKVYELDGTGTIEGIRARDRDTPAPRRGEVLVRMRAAALNYLDLMILDGRFARQPSAGLVPLSDGAGEVAALGDGITRWRSGDRVRGLGSLSIEVVSRALGERDGPRRTDERRVPDNAVSAEARRIHRNTLFENAAAGRYGADVRRAASGGVRLRELVDQLEHAEAAGELQLERALGLATEGSGRDPLPAPGLARVPPHRFTGV